jgi:hypothetical protein
MFCINDNKGFSVSFANGYRVSVQFGPGNYGSNYTADFSTYGQAQEPASTAETALLDPQGNFVPYKDGDVQGYQSPADVLALMNYAASL